MIEAISRAILNCLAVPYLISDRVRESMIVRGP